jgi:hypothetical protein
MIECPDCEGSIDTLSGFCMDCGLDTVECIHEMEEWFDGLPPVESYEEAA